MHKLKEEQNFTGDIKFLTIGLRVPPNGITYIHYLEEKMKVPYRYYKTFRGITIREGTRIPCKSAFYVRDLDANVVFNGDACWELWQKNDIADTQKLGDSFLCSIKEDRLHDVTIAAIQRKSDFLCVGGYNKERKIDIV